MRRPRVHQPGPCLGHVRGRLLEGADDAGQLWQDHADGRHGLAVVGDRECLANALQATCGQGHDDRGGGAVVLIAGDLEGVAQGQRQDLGLDGKLHRPMLAASGTRRHSEAFSRASAAGPGRSGWDTPAPLLRRRRARRHPSRTMLHRTAGRRRPRRSLRPCLPRPSVAYASNCACAATGSGAAASAFTFQGVQIAPGATALARMPTGPYSTARLRVRLSTAPLDDSYAAHLGNATRACSDEMDAMEPPSPCSRKCLDRFRATPVGALDVDPDEASDPVRIRTMDGVLADHGSIVDPAPERSHGRCDPSRPCGRRLDPATSPRTMSPVAPRASRTVVPVSRDNSTPTTNHPSAMRRSAMARPIPALRPSPLRCVPRCPSSILLWWPWPQDYHPLTAPAERPRSMPRCATRVRITTGSTSVNDAAAMPPQSMVFDPT